MTRLTIYVAAALIAAGLIYGLGFSAGGDREIARASDAAIAASDAAQRSMGQRFAAYRAEVDDLAAKNRALAIKLGNAKATRRVVYRSIRQEIPNAITQDLAVSAGSEGHAGNRCAGLGPEFVRVWDTALDPNRAAVPPATGLAAGDAAAAVSAAGIGPAEVLANHVDNAELAADVRAQLQALIDWHLHGEAKP